MDSKANRHGEYRKNYGEDEMEMAGHIMRTQEMGEKIIEWYLREEKRTRGRVDMDWIGRYGGEVLRHRITWDQQQWPRLGYLGTSLA